MKKLVFLFIAILGYTVTVNAQASATISNSAGATIVTPIAIAAGVGMNFGNLTTTTGGTVLLTPAGVRSVATGAVTLPTPAGTVAAATFTVTGGLTSTYTITLPGAASTLTDAGSHTMTVDTWTSNPSSTGTLTAGTQTLAVGGTLHLASGQAVGVYTGSFSVTVNYN